MSNKKKSKNYRIALSIILLTLMLIVSYIEILLPFDIGIVGIKIGLSNIMTIIGIILIGEYLTLVINILRLLIVAVLYGNLVRFSVSTAGFFLSFVVMVFLLKKLNFSIFTSSIFGAVAHNIGQIVAVSFTLKNTEIFYMLPIYIVWGGLSGALIGFITEILYKKIKLIIFD